MKVFLEVSEWHGRKNFRVGQTIHSTKKCSVHEKGKARGNSGGVAILTCKSFVTLGIWDERQTEPSHSWFPPQFPSGQLQLYQEKRLIGGIGNMPCSTCSQTLNG